MPDTPTFGRYAEIPHDQMTRERQDGYRTLIETMLTLAKIPDGPAKTDGIALGHAAAKAMLARWLHDQMNAKAPFTPRNGPGAFQLPGNASPIGTGWGAVTPFTLGNMEEFRFPGPPPLTSERYARDFAEVEVPESRSTIRSTASSSRFAGSATCRSCTRSSWPDPDARSSGSGRRCLLPRSVAAGRGTGATTGASPRSSTVPTSSARSIRCPATSSRWPGPSGCPTSR